MQATISRNSVCSEKYYTKRIFKRKERLYYLC